jgi:Fic family protein
MFKIKQLPPLSEVETIAVLKKLPAAHRALAELKGMAFTIPNQNILINTLSLQEAKDSSAVENIITTHDDLFKAGLGLEALQSIASKEVQNYASALKKGYHYVNERKILTANDIIKIQQELEQNNAGYRKVPGTTLKNAITGEVVYTPPQDYDTIVLLMQNLEEIINDGSEWNADYLVKMAIIHYQFETIHPFYDGNGRTGRIINILYLVLKDLLHIPILYLSRYIISRQQDYYRLLQEVRDKENWEEWIIFMLEGVESTAKETIGLVIAIKELMAEYKHRLRSNYKFYSQDLLNNLFKHPYTKIEFLQKDLNISRLTAGNYLNQLAKDGLLEKKKLGPANYYVNKPLFNLFLK